MINDYKVATGQSSYELEKKVKDLLDHGYKPHGDIVVSPGSSASYYTLFQVMVKEAI